MDMGDFVIVINADKVALTGSKSSQKFAHQHSGYPGGMTSTVYSDLFEKFPTRAVEKAIKGMQLLRPVVVLVVVRKQLPEFV